MNHRNNLRFLQPKSDNINQPLLVYLPGMDGTGRLFYRQIKHLENDFDIRCLYIPDGNRDNWQ
ncbi:MAG: alpha/beta hydrolase, partial [Cyanobacteria bacterium J083]